MTITASLPPFISQQFTRTLTFSLCAHTLSHLHIHTHSLSLTHTHFHIMHACHTHLSLSLSLSLSFFLSPISLSFSYMPLDDYSLSLSLTHTHFLVHKTRLMDTHTRTHTHTHPLLSIVDHSKSSTAKNSISEKNVFFTCEKGVKTRLTIAPFLLLSICPTLVCFFFILTFIFLPAYLLAF